MQPDAVEHGCLLAQLYMLRGQPEDALEVAAALRKAAPQHADVHGLFLVLKEAEGIDQDSSQDLATAYLSLLRCDPAAVTAVQGVCTMGRTVIVLPCFNVPLNLVVCMTLCQTDFQP